MTLETPKEPVFYYECSNGEFRLTYFIPPEKYKGICGNKERKVDKLNLDFPDGVDLRCSRTDFEDFENYYDCKLDKDPEVLRHVFYTIFSSTRNWREFRGTGYVLAKDLEKYQEPVVSAIEKEKRRMEPVKALPAKPTIKDKRQRRREQIARRERIDGVLERFKVREVDGRRTMAKQRFSDIPRREGDRADDVFLRVHQKRPRGGD